MKNEQQSAIREHLTDALECVKKAESAAMGSQPEAIRGEGCCAAEVAACAEWLIRRGFGEAGGRLRRDRPTPAPCECETLRAGLEDVPAGRVTPLEEVRARLEREGQLRKERDHWKRTFHEWSIAGAKAGFVFGKCRWGEDFCEGKAKQRSRKRDVAARRQTAKE